MRGVSLNVSQRTDGTADELPEQHLAAVSWEGRKKLNFQATIKLPVQFDAISLKVYGTTNWAWKAALSILPGSPRSAVLPARRR